MVTIPRTSQKTAQMVATQLKIVGIDYTHIAHYNIENSLL